MNGLICRVCDRAIGEDGLPIAPLPHQQGVTTASLIMTADDDTPLIKLTAGLCSECRPKVGEKP